MVYVGLALFILIPYLMFGMTINVRSYMLKGWFFAPARAFRKFLCGMFLGHEYNDGICTHCLKRRKNGISNKHV